MSPARRWPLALVVLAAAACAGRSVGFDSYTAPCAPTPARDITASGWATIETLAGHYDLQLVNTAGEWGDSLERARLELWVTDSVRRAAFRPQRIGRIAGDRPLGGAADFEGAPPASWDELASRDREHPCVELIGRTLYFGGIDMLDGGGYRLAIQAFSPRGFWGTWKWDGGIAAVYDTATHRRLQDPGGHFCAWRDTH